MKRTRSQLRRALKSWRCEGQQVLVAQTFEDVCPPPCERCGLLPHRCRCQEVKP